MIDPNRPDNDPANPAQAGEPVVSKPYVMPDDPEPGSVELLQKEIAEARDKTLRTLADALREVVGLTRPERHGSAPLRR